MPQDEQEKWPHRSVDVHGRAIPLSADEARRRAEEALQALDDVMAMGDEEEQRATLDALLRARKDEQERRTHRSVDERGRVIPMTEGEVRARAEEIARALDALDDMGDEEEQRQTLEFLIKAIDEDRLSSRARFRENA